MMDLDTGDSLAAVRHGRAALLAAVTCPPARHFAFAAVLGGYIAAAALPLPARLFALLALIVGVVAIVRWDKRRMGVFVNGYRAGRTRWVMAGLLVVLLPTYLLVSWLADLHGLRWPALVAAPLVAAYGYGMSELWMRVFRRELLATR